MRRKATAREILRCMNGNIYRVVFLFDFKCANKCKFKRVALREYLQIRHKTRLNIII